MFPSPLYNENEMSNDHPGITDSALPNDAALNFSGITACTVRLSGFQMGLIDMFNKCTADFISRPQ